MPMASGIESCAVSKRNVPLIGKIEAIVEQLNANRVLAGRSTRFYGVNDDGQRCLQWEVLEAGLLPDRDREFCLQIEVW